MIIYRDFVAEFVEDRVDVNRIFKKIIDIGGEFEVDVFGRPVIIKDGAFYKICDLFIPIDVYKYMDEIGLIKFTDSHDGYKVKVLASKS